MPSTGWESLFGGWESLFGGQESLFGEWESLFRNGSPSWSWESPFIVGSSSMELGVPLRWVRVPLWRVGVPLWNWLWPIFKINLNPLLKTEPVMVRAVSTVFVGFLGKIYVKQSQTYEYIVASAGERELMESLLWGFYSKTGSAEILDLSFTLG